jgi:hypothetical protein
MLSNVIFYPCQYKNEKLNPKLVNAGLVAVGVAMGQFYLRVFALPLSVSFHQYSVFILCLIKCALNK